MEAKGFKIVEKEYNGTKYNVLVLVTDEKENNEKEIGTIKKHRVNCYVKKENK